MDKDKELSCIKEKALVEKTAFEKFVEIISIEGAGYPVWF
jgi:hypothetical protein